MNRRIEYFGKKIGFGFGFFVFSSLFYLILSLLNKIPDYIKYWHIIIGVIVIYLLGLILRRVLRNE